MTDKSDQSEQQVVDARMEYGHLITTYTSLANMIWIGFGAFFTMNTLLATGLGLSYSDASKILDKRFLAFVHIVIPLAGMFISIVAILTARSINNLQGLINKRGKELEALLFARIFTGLQQYSGKFPIETAVGSLFFFTLWAGALYAAT